MNNDFDPLGLGGYKAFARTTSQSQPTQSLQPKKKEKDFWIDQISTIGGLLGGVAGLPLGFLGAGGGAAIGGGLGEAIENIITGEDIGKNVAQETILSGVFGAGPIRLGKALLTGSKGVAQGATGAVGSTATKKALEEPLKTSLQGKMQDLGNKALLSQYGTVSKPVARTTNPTQTIGQLADYGITNPEDAERIARAVTGSSGILNKAVAKSVDKAGGVETTGLRRIAEDALQLNGVVDKDAKSVLAVVDTQLRRLQGGPSGSLSPLANPNDALDVMKALEKRIANLSGKGGNYRLATPEREDQARVLQALHDEIQDRLYRGAGADKNIAAVLTPEVRQQLVALKPNDAKWQQFVDNKVMSARTIEDLRGAQAPFVRAGKIIEDADQNSITFGGRAGNLANNLSASGIGGAIMGTATNLAQPLLARHAGQALRSQGSKQIASRGTITPRPMNPLGLVGRVGVAAPLVSGGIDMLQGNAPSTLEDAIMQTSLDGMQSTSWPEAEQATLAISPYSRENLMYDIQRDPENAEKYISYYQGLQEVYAPQQEEKLSATQLETANRAQNALLDLDVLRQAVESGDILKTGIPFSDNPLVGNALGTTDIEAALFNIGDVILRARTGAQAPESEVRAFVRGFLPRAGESKESQLNKLNRAYRELMGMANPAAASQSTDLVDAILASQR